MAKNPYAKTVKLFSKAEDLYISRKGEAVFISEGHVIVEMHIAAYDAFFRPASGQFIELEDGEKASRRGNMALPEKNAAAPDVGERFNKFEEESTESVTASPFLMEYSPDGKKKHYQRMLTGHNYYVAVDNDFYAVSEEIGFTSFRNKGNSVSAIFAKSGTYNGIVILPIRADQQKIESFVNVTK